MNDIVVLQDTLNPISAQERVKINQNWDALRRGFSSLQNQINFLSGGTEVDVIVARIEQAIQDAQTNTQNAIDNVNNNYAEKLVEINQSLTDLSAALTNSQMATNQANEARDNAVNATNDALTAIDQIQLAISNLSSRGDFVLGTQYYKGNIVSNGQGSSYIAKQDNINLPLTNTTNWMLLASRGLQGIQGERGETGSGFLVKGYFANLQDLENTIVSPETGDAYGIGTAEPYDIYIYDGINNVWVNNGALQGAKGDRGERGEVGPEGPAGETQDLTPIQNQIDNHENRITDLENREVVTKSDVSGLNREVAYLKLKQEVGDRIEGGTVFADDFNGSRFGFEIKAAKTESNVALNRGETILTGKVNPIRDGEFTVGSQVIVIDAADSEMVEVTRSELIEDNQNFVINNEVLVANAYSTNGNGGRKIVRLDNGWIVAVVIGMEGGINNACYFYVYKNSIEGWVYAFNIQRSGSTGFVDVALVADGTKVNILSNFNSLDVIYNSVDMVSYAVDQNYGTVSKVIESQTAVGNVSLAYDKTTNTLHAAWSSKNATYPNNFGIRYSKSTDGGATWSTVENIAAYSDGTSQLSYPEIVVVNSKPRALFAQVSNTLNRLQLYNNDSGEWAQKEIYEGGTYAQIKPSSTVDAMGIVHTVWQGADAETPSTQYIRYYNPTLGTGAFWTNTKKIAVGQNPCIVTDKNGHMFITYENASSTYYVKSMDDGATWSSPILIGAGTNPSTLDDNSLVYAVPPTVQMNSSNVIFNGNWSIINDVYNLEISPLINSYVNGSIIAESSINTDGTLLNPLSSKSILSYSIPSTSYVGAFIKKTGNATIQSYLNNQLMSSKLEGDEYSFEGQLNIESPVTLRIELNKTNPTVGNVVRLTRILGGRS